MGKEPTGSKRRWLISAVGATVILGGLLLLFRAPQTAPTEIPAANTKPPIILTPGRGDELAMRDLAPLFLPTPYNASVDLPKAPQPGAQYFEVDPGAHLSFDPDSPALHLPPAVVPPANPVDALANVPPPLAKGIGETDAGIPAMPPSGGHVDVFADDHRDSILAVTLPVDAKPPAAGRETLGWRPLELTAAVDAAGLVGPLSVSTSSGVEEVDNHFRNYLARTFRIGDRLSPGFYRIVVGP